MGKQFGPIGGLGKPFAAANPAQARDKVEYKFVSADRIVAGILRAGRIEAMSIDVPKPGDTGFHVDGDGNLTATSATITGATRIGGSIVGATIDVPDTGVAGFHLDGAGDFGIGGTTATSSDNNILATAAGMLSARTATFYPKDNTSVGLTIKNDKSSTANLVEIYAPTGATLAAWVRGNVSSPGWWVLGESSVFTNATDTQPRAKITSGASLVLGAGGSTAVDWSLFRSAADEATIANGDSLVFGGTRNRLDSSGFISMTEISAPATPAANVIALYAKDTAGVSRLYYKDDGGTEHGPL